ncbi:MAG: hypothetical protein F6K13_29280, partial [Okeania sp. SIO2B9]|nr:hypothetical protein [Okeania sp. SIO2B9]
TWGGRVAFWFTSNTKFGARREIYCEGKAEGRGQKAEGLEGFGQISFS